MNYKKLITWLIILLASYVSIGLLNDLSEEQKEWDRWQTYFYALSETGITPLYFVAFLAVCYYALKPCVKFIVGKKRKLGIYIAASAILFIVIVELTNTYSANITDFIKWEKVDNFSKFLVKKATNLKINEGDKKFSTSELNEISSDFSSFFLVCLVAFHFLMAWIASLVVTVWQGWYQSFPEQERLKMENMQSRLETMEKELEVNRKEALLAQSQLDPHHLSNELNDLYLMVLKNDERAAESLRLLAHFMRRIISKESKGMIPLEREIENLRSYVNYERYCHRLTSPILEVRDKNKVVKEVLIPANILLPIAENVFKYGVATNENPPSLIITLKRDKFIFETRNKINEARMEVVKSGGMGYKNLEQVLDTFLPGATFKHKPKGSLYISHLEAPIQ